MGSSLRIFRRVEEYLEDEGSLEGGLFCLVSSSRKDPYNGQSQEAACHCN
jgi:hypothetical protein